MNIKDNTGMVHCEDPSNFQYTLCGMSYDAPVEDGNYDVATDNIMVKTSDKITCDRCIKIIKYCKTIKIGKDTK